MKKVQTPKMSPRLFLGAMLLGVALAVFAGIQYLRRNFTIEEIEVRV